MIQAKFECIANVLLCWLIVLSLGGGDGRLTGKTSSVTAASTDVSSAGGNERRVVCYYTNWSVYRPGNAKFTPQNINPYLCTHLIYAFGGFTKENTLKPFDKYQDIEQGGYAKFTGLKTYNKKLKTLLAIGGWNEASTRFSPMVANEEKRTTFTKNVIKFLRQNHFDGLDLDWEYPAFRDGGKPRDRANYAQFVQELAEEFRRESSKTGRPRLLLTMAVPAGIEYVEKGYDIPKLNQYLDWFNLLTYDYHSAFEPSVNHHAPLYSLVEADEYNYDSELNIDYTIKHYINQGADRQKLVLGIPTYGRSYTLFNAEANELGAPTDGPGEQGDATREKGYLAYYEICQRVKDEDWTVVSPNENAMGPYAYKDNQWVGYDDEEIVRKKASYVLENDLGGIMFWSIDNDDFRGTCTGKPFPLIEAAKDTLLQDISSSNYLETKPIATKKTTPAAVPTKASQRRKNRPKRPTPKPTSTARYEEYSIASRPSGTTTTPAPPTTPDSGTDFKCEDEGFFPHPRDCKKYFWCLDSGPSQLGIVAHQFTCPSGLFFNKLADSCDYTRNVVCSKSKTSTTTTSSTTSTPPRTTSAAPKRTPIRPLLRTTTPTTTTTTTTTEAYEEEEYDDEEYNEEEGGDSIGLSQTALDSEDPKVIKELIDLIKKVGGIEELEKQLKQNQDGSHVLVNQGTSTTLTTTPASIHKKLYEKILRKPIPGVAAIKDSLRPFTVTTEVAEVTTASSSNQLPKYSSIYRATAGSNSRPGPQNAGLDAFADTEGLRNEKPQYITITRNRPATSQLQEEVRPVFEQDDEVNDNDNEGQEDDEAVDSTITRSTESTFVRYTIPEHVEVTGHDENYRLSSGFDGQTQQSSSTPYVTIHRTTTTTSPRSGSSGIDKIQQPTTQSSIYQTIKRGQSNQGDKQPQSSYAPNSVRTNQEQPSAEVEDEEDKTFAVVSSSVSTVSPNPERSTLHVTRTFAASTPSPAMTFPKYTSTNRQQQNQQTKDENWQSTLSYDTENILNGLGLQTSSPADQIHIRLTATTESIHEQVNSLLNADVAGRYDTTASEISSSSPSAEGNDTATPIYTTIMNPIKLIITTSGALGHHNHHYHQLGMANNNDGFSYDGYEDNENNDDDDDENLDLASLLAHHEASLDMEGVNNATLKTAQDEPTVDIIQGNVVGGGMLVPFDEDTVKDRPPQATTTDAAVLNINAVPVVGGSTGGYRKRIRVPPPKRTTESPSIDNEINQVKLTTRPIFRHTRTTTTTTTPVPNTSTATHSTVPFFRKRNRPSILSGTSTTTTPKPSSTTSKPRLVVRRKLFRTSSTTTSTPAPLPSTAAPDERGNLESATSLNSLNDQELGSSITQENKFLNNRFNQIGESDVDGDFGAAIQAISKAPLPVPVSTTSKYRLNSYAPSQEINRGTPVNPVKETTSTTSFPANHKRLKIKKISSRLRTSTPEFVTATAATTERHYNKPILIMTNDRPNRQRPKPFEKVNPKKTTSSLSVIGNEQSPVYGGDLPAGATGKPHFDYDYYDENDDQFIGKIRAQVKVILHGNGHIECLDQGNFPHPLQCKKFISCAKIESGGLVGWEYTCPRGLSYDPVGGICNWAAGLGCKEN